jgi:uncharacterized protein YegL
MTFPGFGAEGDDLGEISYASGIGQRLPLMLCLDTSFSMRGAPGTPVNGSPIASLNEALAGWSAELRSDVQLKTTVQVAMVTFGDGGVRAWQGSEPLRAAANPFVPAAEFYPPPLGAGGVTLLTEAVELAVRHVNSYKGWLKGNGYTYYRPLIFLLTDGVPTDADGKPSGSWQRLVPELAAARRDNGFEFYAIGVGNLTANAEQVLAALAPNGFRILGGFPFRSLLRLLSATIEKVMDGSGQEVPLLTQPVMDPFANFFSQRPAGQ